MNTRIHIWILEFIYEYGPRTCQGGARSIVFMISGTYSYMNIHHSCVFMSSHIWMTRIHIWIRLHSYMNTVAFLQPHGIHIWILYSYMNTGGPSSAECRIHIWIPTFGARGPVFIYECKRNHIWINMNTHEYFGIHIWMPENSCVFMSSHIWMHRIHIWILYSYMRHIFPFEREK